MPSQSPIESNLNEPDLARRQYAWVMTGLKLAVAGLGIGLIVWTVDWQDQLQVLEDGSQRTVPGALTLLKQASWWMLGVAFIVALPVVVLQSARWWLLVRCGRLPLRYGQALKLTWAGLFFNFCLPGSTGGDLYRAAQLMRIAGRSAGRSDVRGAPHGDGDGVNAGGGGGGGVIGSLVVDRVVGLVAMVLIGGVGSLVMWDDPVGGTLAKTVLVGAGILFVGISLYLSGVWRKLIGLDRWMNKLPGGRFVLKVDEALLAYRGHGRVLLQAFGLGMVVHGCLILAMGLCGRALGIESTWGTLFVVVPVLFAAQAMPLTYQGLGVMEAIGVSLLVTGDGLAANNQVVGMLLLYRMVQVLMGLLGALVLVLPVGLDAEQNLVDK